MGTKNRLKTTRKRHKISKKGCKTATKPHKTTLKEKKMTKKIFKLITKRHINTKRCKTIRDERKKCKGM